jgi:hypothetical protein
MSSYFSDDVVANKLERLLHFERNLEVLECLLEIEGAIGVQAARQS